MNFLIRGFGKETWEYSPVYAIRSWAYLLPYAIPTFTLPQLVDKFQLPPQIIFYTIRFLIASFTVYSEIHLYQSLKSTTTHLTGGFYIVFSTMATGMSHASVAFLPSTFAMNCTTLATSNLIRYFAGRNMKHALLVTSWFALGGILGWPFALILAVFSALVIIYQNIKNYKLTTRYIGWSLFIVALYVGLSMEIDTKFYKKTVLVPLNIVLYNVIYADENAGPNIFGVEPLSYYIYNLLLNFNIFAPLAYIGLIFVPLARLFAPKFQDHKLSSLQFLAVLSPIGVWSIIFFSQPHKEERFLYPIYSTILLSASLMLTYIFDIIQSFTLKVTQSRNTAFTVYVIAITIFSFTSQILSISRTMSLSDNYIAPLNVYNKLPVNASGNLCVGREWYRFPSSFFLPKDVRLRFIKSNFNGLLPGDFDESIDRLDAISAIPPNMNNLNEFDPSKLFDFDQCDYAIDISQPIDPESGEIEFMDKSGNVRKGWELVHSEPFLNNEESSGIGRILSIPEPLIPFINSKLVYHQYNLYKKTEGTLL